MLWWEEGFCAMLAHGGRFVIRYDHRDTGRSVSYEPGHPEYLVDSVRVLAGAERPFDEDAARVFIRRDVERARNFAARQNHDFIPDDGPQRGPLSSIVVPTLVIHGSADPLFPAEHGEAIAAEIPDARLLALEGAGHGVDRHDWETIAAAILEQTA